MLNLTLLNAFLLGDYQESNKTQETFRGRKQTCRTAEMLQDECERYAATQGW